MNKEIIKQKVLELDWKLPISVQQNAIDYLLKIEDKYLYLLFVFDARHQCTWENSMEIIARIGFPRNKILLPKLIYLLQDINWPGACKAVEILKSGDKKILVPLVEKAIIQAYKHTDYMWIGGLKLVVDETPILKEDFSNPKIYEFLKYSEI